MKFSAVGPRQRQAAAAPWAGGREASGANAGGGTLREGTRRRQGYNFLKKYAFPLILYFLF